MIYFGGCSFMNGQGLESEESLPYILSSALNKKYIDDSQISSSNKLIYLRAMNHLLSQNNTDLYVIMWSRGIDRRFEHILDYDLKERWVNIIPCANQKKDDKIRNDINKFVLENFVTDSSSFINTLTYMVSLQEMFKLHNKKYIYCFAHSEFMDLYKDTYKDYAYWLEVKDDVKDFTKSTDMKPLIRSLDFDNILEYSYTDIMGDFKNDKHPNSEQCVKFAEYFMGEYEDK